LCNAERPELTSGLEEWLMAHCKDLDKGIPKHVQRRGNMRSAERGPRPSMRRRTRVRPRTTRACAGVIATKAQTWAPVCATKQPQPQRLTANRDQAPQAPLRICLEKPANMEDAHAHMDPSRRSRPAACHQTPRPTSKLRPISCQRQDSAAPPGGGRTCPCWTEKLHNRTPSKIPQ